MLLGPGTQALAQEPVTAQQVKAAYLFRFLSFVEWPATRMGEAQAALVVGIAGTPAMAAELRALVGTRRAQGHPVAVRTVDVPEDAGGLHLLFVAAGAPGGLPAWDRFAERATLLVTDREGALDQGSMINFIQSGGRIRFAVSLPNAERAGLRISSHMLAVATEVRSRPP
ncbi:MAG TPA: YfiR family protein [Burkholderiales bacterium]|nr:YfiR family protein [Burkholderiales bacterium]